MNKTQAPKALISPNKVWVMVLLINAFENGGATHDPELPLYAEELKRKRRHTHSKQLNDFQLFLSSEIFG